MKIYLNTFKRVNKLFGITIKPSECLKMQNRKIPLCLNILDIIFSGDLQNIYHSLVVQVF